MRARRLARGVSTLARRWPRGDVCLVLCASSAAACCPVGFVTVGPVLLWVLL